MVNLQTFVEMRQQDQATDGGRQAVGDQYRVAVPPAKLSRAGSTCRDHKPNGPPSNIAPAKLKLGSNRRETHGFDTDADNLEDTTITSISAKRNGHTNAGEFYNTGRSMARDTTAGPFNMHDHPGYHKALTRMIDESSASEYDDDGSNDSDGGENPREYYALSSHGNDFQNAEFVNFKKHNILDKSLFQALRPRQDLIAEMGPAMSFCTPASALQTTRPSSRSPTPTHEYVGQLSSSKSNYSKRDVQKIEDHVARHVSDLDQAMLSSLVSEDHQELRADIARTHQLPNRASHPSSQDTHANVHSIDKAAKLEFLHEQITNEKPLPHQVDSAFDNHIGPISEFRDTGGVKSVVESELKRGTLKRRHSLDHGLHELNAMTFQQLREESIDKIHSSVASVLKSELVNATLDAKLKHLSSVEDPGVQHGRQQAFFDSLSIEEYAESGNIIGTNLSGVIAKLSRIRQNKRDLAGKFENEIAKREALIENKTAALKEEKVVMTRQTEELTAWRMA